MKTNTDKNLHIIYHWNSDENVGIDLNLLGDSIAGFNKVIREILKSAKVQGDFSIQAQIIKEGSIDVGTLVQFLSPVPFENWQDLFNFIAIIGERELLEHFRQAAQIHRNINDYFSKNPFDQQIITVGIGFLVGWVAKQKQAPTVRDNGRELPVVFAARLKRLIIRRVFKKALRPFVENQITKIEVKTENRVSVVINNENFSEYLGEEEQILPEYEDGKSYQFAGRLVGLEKSMGEHLKFKMSQLPRPYNILVATPQEGRSTKDYIEYYDKDVFLEAEVSRISMYHKPKLKLLSVRLAQSSLKI